MEGRIAALAFALVRAGEGDPRPAVLAAPRAWVREHGLWFRDGLLGLGLWLAVLFWPLARPWGRRSPALCFFILTQATVMLVADMLSLQIGLNLFVFGYGLLVVAEETKSTGG